MKDIIKPIAVLAAICLVVTALLAYINSVTAPIIADANAKAEAKAQHEVLTEADAFENIDVENAGLPKEVTKAVKATN
ncbi:MAG: electron transporter RnfG, partial [Ruminococcus sp.]|nr:electron transporter RnfG [Ruminococcus sp.]